MSNCWLSQRTSRCLDDSGHSGACYLYILCIQCPQVRLALQPIHSGWSLESGRPPKALQKGGGGRCGGVTWPWAKLLARQNCIVWIALSFWSLRTHFVGYSSLSNDLSTASARVFHSPHLCVGFLFLILYPGLLLLPPPPSYIQFTLTYNNNFTHTNLTYNNFTHTQT